MRKITNINSDWEFTKTDHTDNNSKWQQVTIPHTWNNIDGQDGGNDYYRGLCAYKREIDINQEMLSGDLYLEFNGVNSSAEVFVNRKLVIKHDGGYSIFRANIKDAVKVGVNELVVTVDNGINDYVYPQKADFTFYGGIYRNVNIIEVPKSHFALNYFGGKGIKVTPVIENEDARVKLEVYTENTENGSNVKFTLSNGQEAMAVIKDNYAQAEIVIKNVHLWNGVKDPYLYEAVASLDSEDVVKTKFGCRYFEIDKDRGFILNGEQYRLCGAARHQDRQGVGNALTNEMQDEDMSIMKEMGLNTIRLAHYQHDQYFYDLCDKEGMVVWAEIPYITEHLENGCENSISQLKELIVQNYNHPSIVTWGLSNEITATTGSNQGIIDNHKNLNEIAHKLDNTRPTVMANVFMLEITDELVTLPDLTSYNLYYGWYVGEAEDNDEWFDNFRKQHPDIPVGLSEFGADANPQFQAADCNKGDWTESYQAKYHEHMLKMWEDRPYIWALHAWNMFDFGADGRDEGGKPGQNQKGLVTFDRKIKKDAYYIYKAYLSDQPFVHITGKRYIKRHEPITEIKVYSNQPEVSLYVDGNKVQTLTGDKVFKFEVEISGKHSIIAKSGDLQHQIDIEKVSEQAVDYMKAPEQVVNWFDRGDMNIIDGYFSIKDSVGEIKKHPEAKTLLEKVEQLAIEAYGDVAKNIKIPDAVLEQMNRASVEDSLAQAGSVITPEIIIELNNNLNKIKKMEE